MTSTAYDDQFSPDPDAPAPVEHPPIVAAMTERDENECRSCVNDKCVTGPECVTLGADGTNTESTKLGSEFIQWFYSESHRQKYSNDHSAFLAAYEAWKFRTPSLIAAPLLAEIEILNAELDNLRAANRRMLLDRS